MNYRIAFNPTTKVVNVLLPGEAVPTGATNIGNFDHAVALDVLGTKENHVIFHHVRDALYFLGVQDMESIHIFMSNTEIVVPTAITPTANAMFVGVGQTGFMNINFTPTNATDMTLTYVSSVPAKATVANAGTVTSGTGVKSGRVNVTGVAVGDTTITATHPSTGLTTTILVTVTA